MAAETNGRAGGRTHARINGRINGRAHPAPSTNKSLTTPSAFVVDDDPLVRRALARRLHGTFEVQLAGTVTQALTLLERRPRVDLALVDFELPDGTGEVVLYRLRRWPRAVRILMSGNLQRLESPGRCGAWVQLMLRKPVSDRCLEVIQRAAQKLALDR
jgi:CheY-like chemotaxis protein